MGVTSEFTTLSGRFIVSSMDNMLAFFRPLLFLCRGLKSAIRKIELADLVNLKLFLQDRLIYAVGIFRDRDIVMMFVKSPPV